MLVPAGMTASESWMDLLGFIMSEPNGHPLTPPLTAMKALKYLSFAGKLAGFVSA